MSQSLSSKTSTHALASMTLNATQLCIVVLNRTLVKRIGTTGLRLDSIASLQPCEACHNKVQRHGLNRDTDEVASLR